MTLISNEAAIVYNATDLRDAVSSAYPDINTIYFGADIQLTFGIPIDTAKTNLVIDGYYPDISPDNRRLIDMDSDAQANTLYIYSFITAVTMTVTLRNMRITGRNYFGVPSVYEGSQYNGVTLIYQNVTYEGAQITFNPNGITRYIDCDIHIATSYALAEEVGEVGRVEFNGTVNIVHESTGDAVFWFRGDDGMASMTVLPGAQVTISTANYFMYNLHLPFYTTNLVAYNIQAGASFTLTSNRGISESTSHILSSFTVGENALFHYSQATNNGTNATVYLNGPLSVGQGATFYMEKRFAATGAFIRFTTGTGLLSISNPKSFVLYSGGVAALSFAAAKTFAFQSGQLNEWLTATAFPTAGTFADIPPYKWHKTLYAPFVWNGTASSTVTSTTLHDFTTAELVHPVTDLQLHNARVLSLGAPALTVNPVVNNTHPITGTADPFANIRVTYTVGGTNFDLRGTADAAGAYTIPISESEIIPTNTTVTVSANIPFLIIELLTTALEAGELTLLSSPALIQFIFERVSQDPPLLGRSDPNVRLVVYDSRVYSSEWEIWASLAVPLTTASGYSLPDGVVYRDDSGFTPLSSTSILVYTGAPNDGTPLTTNVQWPANRGILLHTPQPIFVGERYVTHMEWELRG